jgi:hypothetical protein
MAASAGQPQVVPGPWGWENARAKRAGEPQIGTIEIGCYTDFRELWRDSVEVGVYTVLTPLSLRGWEVRPEVPRLGMVLRVQQYLGNPDEYVDPTWEQLEPKNYHGAVAWEELAALVSLALGVRLRAGGIMRIFGGTDPLGHPHEMDPPPYLPTSSTEHQQMLPGIRDYGRKIDYSRLSLLDNYPRMSVKQARALVRSARSYQEAIWIAEGDPRQAWLRLVTAVETAAAELRPRLTNEEQLKAVYPDTADQILNCGDPELVEWFAKKIAEREGAQAYFLAFLKKFGPGRPPHRPRPSEEKQNWTALDQQLKSIYKARSNDLHSGSPIPRTMCEAPYRVDKRIASEVVSSRADKQVRLRLHVFEYIVRHALLSWANSITI